MIYAMLLRNHVIDIVNSEEIPKYPPTIMGEEITAVKGGESVELGMYYDSSTGEFYFPEPEPQPEPKPTQLDRIEDAVNKRNADIAQEAIDNYTLELVKEGVL